ncbi:MAG: dihydroorotate dehydrogenase electron transfer subunit [Eubacteriales bacterium]|nr:dihydroorotate dehydrogenase electron transfer subunit [Eubacteriales bacterium]
MIRESLFEIAENSPLSENVRRLRLRGDTSAITVPGQFVNLRIDGVFLRRPLSVCDCEEDTLTVIYRITGEGTELLSKKSSGTLNVLTGLGNGFDLSLAGSSPLLIGGGMGFTPLYYLAKKLERPTVILGFNTESEILYEKEFRALGAEVIIATADGSRGIKGFVTDAMESLSYSYFYSCGPEAMFRAICGCAKTDGEFSFEARMGCGFGACMGCSCKTVTGSKRICRDGPVLKRSELLW